MDEVLIRNALNSMLEATKDDATPIIRRLARVQARAALDNLASAPAGDGSYSTADVAEAIRIARDQADKVYGIRWMALEEISRFELFAAALARPRAAVPPGSDAAYFGASDAACTLYPGTDQQAERAAFCEGAAHAVSRPRAAVGEREAAQRLQVFADGANFSDVYGSEWCLEPVRQMRADLRAILALQSPPAKVEG